ncbi:MAG: hypothetical protein K8S00_11035 [Bacteroidales bacterium]|nr:hypothetical protein [Bacteroidales bacterium]
MNKYYQKSKAFILSALIFVAITSNVYADGIAGPDRTICKGDTITIGSDGSNASDCFYWDNDQWMHNPYNPKTKVWPEQTITYKLTRTSDDFSETEIAYVTITVADQINSITATAEMCCWNAGESISLDQFDIITNPPGLGDVCDISPTTVPSGTLTVGVYTTDVTISNQCGTSSFVEDIVIIDCADENMASSISPYSINIMEMLDVINGISKKAKVLPCDPGTSIVGTITNQTFAKCCPNRKGTYKPCIDDDMRKVAIDLTFSASIECRAPWGVPYVAAAYALAGIGGGGKIEISLANDCDALNPCFELTPYGSIWGGVEFELGPAILTAQGLIKGTVTMPAVKYCSSDAKMKIIGDEVCAQIDGEINFTLASFYSVVFTHTFWKGCTSLR